MLYPFYYYNHYFSSLVITISIISSIHLNLESLSRPRDFHLPESRLSQKFESPSPNRCALSALEQTRANI